MISVSAMKRIKNGSPAVPVFVKLNYCTSSDSFDQLGFINCVCMCERRLPDQSPSRTHIHTHTHTRTLRDNSKKKNDGNLCSKVFLSTMSLYQWVFFVTTVFPLTVIVLLLCVYWMFFTGLDATDTCAVPAPFFALALRLANWMRTLHGRFFFGFVAMVGVTAQCCFIDVPRCMRRRRSRASAEHERSSQAWAVKKPEKDKAAAESSAFDGLDATSEEDVAGATFLPKLAQVVRTPMTKPAPLIRSPRGQDRITPQTSTRMDDATTRKNDPLQKNAEVRVPGEFRVKCSIAYQNAVEEYQGCSLWVNAAAVEAAIAEAVAVDAASISDSAI